MQLATRHDGRFLIPVILLLAAGSPGLYADGDDEPAWFSTSEACLAGKLQRAAWSAKAFDEDTGRDLRHFPPDRVVNYLHMTLMMRFDDLDEARFTATETLRFVPIAEAVSAITLNAVGLDITTVKLEGEAIEHYQDDETLTLRFDPPLPPGEPREVVIQYSCIEPYTGMFFTPSSPAAPHYTAEVHTQGESIYNRHWFASHDAPNERMTTELIVDVPSGLAVSSNGRLISTSDDGSRAVWHYLQDKPHVSYLVSLIIGKFDIVEIPPPKSGLPMHVWVPQGLGDRVMQTYGRTGEMIDVLEQRFGIAYPWDRYDQILVKNFGPGAMENTSVTTMYPTAVLDKTALLDRDLEGLIAHEVAHQWTGDLLTCKSWAHIWLNEGWATYGAALWFEHRDGEDGYLDRIRHSFRVARDDHTTNDLPMVSPVYEHPRETFRRAANPYPKGSSIIHMLRMMLGDEVFFKGVHLYMNRHALGTVETNDFRYALEEVSGRGLEWFFEQWCYRPGTPELEVELRYEAETRELLVDVQQVQHIDERTPAFRFMLPVFVQTASGEQSFYINVREKATSYRTTLDGPPSIVAVDPYLHVLKTITVNKPQSMSMTQATNGPTIAARHAAIEALGETDIPQAVSLLSQIIADESIRYSLRNTAVDSLAGFGSDDAKAELLSIIADGVAEARVRATLVEKLENFDQERVVEILADLAGNDPSYATRVAAIEALAHHEAAEHADLIAQLVDFPSQHDRVRQAALRALAELDDSRGLDLGIQYAAYGYMDRSRSAAIETIGKLAEHDQDRAVEFLLGLLNDPERRTVRAAAGALADIGDERALDPIRAMAETHPNPRLQESAEKWLETLEKAQEETNDE
ncbi:MAG: HEAT repeat domain-containing protein [Planctomycetes bacterium]|nr:HEAT repeat domain-containing protein [Planctomycetota bacterium]